jgi:hypothetical protein
MPPDFHGASFVEEHDGARLLNLRANVRTLMVDGEWRTRSEISDLLGVSRAADIGRRLRELKEPKHGGWNVETRRRGTPKEGIWEYRVAGLLPPEDPAFPSDAPALVEALRSDPEAAVLGAAREYAETCMNTDDPAEVQSALDRLTRAALNL